MIIIRLKSWKLISATGSYTPASLEAPNDSQGSHVTLIGILLFGQIIPEKILHLAKKLALNVHASLLPKYRGASPIQYSL